MSRANGRRASRPKRPEKLLIYAFYEGESEKQYLQQLKRRYDKVAVIKIVSKSGLFEEAVSQFEKNPSLRDYTNETDEIWFFFDTGDTDGNDKSWDFILPRINKLRKKKKKPGIRVRLLMTTGCLEYWLVLHFQKYRPSIQCKEERDRVETDLNQLCQKTWNLAYEKGDPDITRRVFETGLETACENGAFYLHALELKKDGLPPLENPSEPDARQLDERYQWLLSSRETFTTVQEAVAALRARSPIT